MNHSRLNRKIFVWANSVARSTCKNWNFKVCKMLKDYNLERFCNIDIPIQKHDIYASVLPKILDSFKQDWLNDVNRETARNGNGHNKLRLYRTFKQTYETEGYCRTIFNRSYRGAIALFRSGTAPIGIELGRYNGLPVEQRVCFHCPDTIEDETHVLLHCSLYETIRFDLLQKAEELDAHFVTLSDTDKVGFLLSNSDIAYYSAKTCFNILNKRKLVLYNNNL